MKSFYILLFIFSAAILLLVNDVGIAKQHNIIYSSPAKACKLTIRSYNASSQTYGILASVVVDCGNGNSLACENLNIVLDAVDINTNQIYHTTSTLSVSCGNSNSKSVFLQLPSPGTFQYRFTCVGDDTYFYYVDQTGFLSR